MRRAGLLTLLLAGAACGPSVAPRASGRDARPDRPASVSESHGSAGAPSGGERTRGHVGNGKGR